MKLKKKRALAAKRKAIAAGTNNGWLNFALEVSCRECIKNDAGAYCEYIGDNLTLEKGCVKTSYEEKRTYWATS